MLVWRETNSFSFRTWTNQVKMAVQKIFFSDLYVEHMRNKMEMKKNFVCTTLQKCIKYGYILLVESKLKSINAVHTETPENVQEKWELRLNIVLEILDVTISQTASQVLNSHVFNSHISINYLKSCCSDSPFRGIWWRPKVKQSHQWANPLKFKINSVCFPIWFNLVLSIWPTQP